MPTTREASASKKLATPDNELVTAQLLHSYRYCPNNKSISPVVPLSVTKSDLKPQPTLRSNCRSTLPSLTLSDRSQDHEFRHSLDLNPSPSDITQWQLDGNVSPINDTSNQSNDPQTLNSLDPNPTQPQPDLITEVSTSTTPPSQA